LQNLGEDATADAYRCTEAAEFVSGQHSLLEERLFKANLPDPRAGSNTNHKMRGVFQQNHRLRPDPRAWIEDGETEAFLGFENPMQIPATIARKLQLNCFWWQR
jgi:hypothetical protein